MTSSAKTAKPARVFRKSERCYGPIDGTLPYSGLELPDDGAWPTTRKKDARNAIPAPAAVPVAPSLAADEI